MSEILMVIQQVLIWTITIYWVYQITISVFSLIKLKEKPFIVDKNHRFMAILPAHNEEDVIGNLVDSLRKQNYPKELLDIYVIADNCTDNTAYYAREAGAIVYERFDEEKKTKGYALNWFLGKMIEQNAEYDALLVFDADNIVDSNFVNEMNKKLCQGEEVVQGYRDIKNPSDSWIASGYALFYWSMNKFYHLARYNLGLSPLINGTGFMVKYDIIKEQNGWNTQTLTEDIEFSLMTIAGGKKLGWAKDAIVYDEQPLEFGVSWKQRSRWTVGHLQCINIHLRSLIQGFARNKNLVSFDGMLYLFGIPVMFVTLLLLFVNAGVYLSQGMTLQELIIHNVRWIGATFVLPIFMSALVVKIDKRDLKSMRKGIILFPIFMASWILINIKCMFKRDIKWEKIKHSKDVKIEEIA